jgi:hypothetical protein
MSVYVEKFRRPLDGGWDPAGEWGYAVRTPIDGPIAIEGLQDAVLRYLDGTLERSDRDCVIACRDDLIEAEPVWRQFVRSHVAAKGHTFSYEVVWVVGDRTAVCITFVPPPRDVETPADLGQHEVQALPQSIAEGLRFTGPIRRRRGAWKWSSMQPSTPPSSGDNWSPRIPRSPLYEES